MNNPFHLFAILGFFLCACTAETTRSSKSTEHPFMVSGDSHLDTDTSYEVLDGAPLNVNENTLYYAFFARTKPAQNSSETQQSAPGTGFFAVIVATPKDEPKENEPNWTFRVKPCEVDTSGKKVAGFSFKIPAEDVREYSRPVDMGVFIDPDGNVTAKDGHFHIGNAQNPVPIKTLGLTAANVHIGITYTILGKKSPKTNDIIMGRHPTEDLSLSATLDHITDAGILGLGATATKDNIEEYLDQVNGIERFIMKVLWNLEDSPYDRDELLEPQDRPPLVSVCAAMENLPWATRCRDNDPEGCFESAPDATSE